LVSCRKTIPTKIDNNFGQVFLSDVLKNVFLQKIVQQSQTVFFSIKNKIETNLTSPGMSFGLRGTNQPRQGPSFCFEGPLPTTPRTPKEPGFRASMPFGVRWCYRLWPWPKSSCVMAKWHF
jgi:hypothetical protein